MNKFKKKDKPEVYISLKECCKKCGLQLDDKEHFCLVRTDDLLHTILHGMYRADLNNKPDFKTWLRNRVEITRKSLEE